MFLFLLSLKLNDMQCVSTDLLKHFISAHSTNDQQVGMEGRYIIHTLLISPAIISISPGNYHCTCTGVLWLPAINLL